MSHAKTSASYENRLLKSQLCQCQQRARAAHTAGARAPAARCTQLALIAYGLPLARALKRALAGAHEPEGCGPNFYIFFAWQ